MNNIAKMAMIQQMARDDTRNERTRNEDARNEATRMNQGEYYPPRDDMPESRRRRDSRGRYMEGDTEMRRYMEDDPEMRSYNGDMPESRFRDRRGREHYDDGRFAPRNEERYDRDTSTWDYSPEERRANIHALPPSNLIGFMGRDERRMQHGEHREQEQRMGRSQGAKPFDQEMAQEWVQGMKNSDGSSGAHWTLDQAKNLMAQSGVTGIQPVEFWAILNSIRSDFYRVAKKHGVDRPEFYSDMARSWLDDKDAVEDKAAAYFEYVVKH